MEILSKDTLYFMLAITHLMKCVGLDLYDAIEMIDQLQMDISGHGINSGATP